MGNRWWQDYEEEIMKGTEGRLPLPTQYPKPQSL